MDRFNVLGLGCVAVDDLLYVGAYPPADAKAQVRRPGAAVRRADGHGAGRGGPAGGTVRLRRDAWATTEFSQFVVAAPAAGTHRRAVPAAPRRCAADPFGDHRRPGPPDAHDLLRSGRRGTGRAPIGRRRMSCEPRGCCLSTISASTGMLRATRLARSAGIPVVADFESVRRCPAFAELVAAGRSPDRVPGLRSAVDRLRAARRGGPGAVVGRSGRRWWSPAAPTAVGTWAVRPRRGLAINRRMPCQVVDTTGCGDVFHGAYAAALAQGPGPAGAVAVGRRYRRPESHAARRPSGHSRHRAVEAFLQERHP